QGIMDRSEKTLALFTTVELLCIGGALWLSGYVLLLFVTKKEKLTAIIFVQYLCSILLLGIFMIIYSFYPLPPIIFMSIYLSIFLFLLIRQITYGSAHYYKA